MAIGDIHPAGDSIEVPTTVGTVHQAADAVEFPNSDQPGFMEGLKAGFMQQPVKTAPGVHAADVGHFIGQEALPAAGAAIGALSSIPAWLTPAGPAATYVASGAGAAAGRSVQKAISQLMEGHKDETAAETIGDVALTGAVTTALPVLTKVAGPVWNYTAGLKRGAYDMLMDSPHAIIKAIGNVSKEEVDLAAIKLASSMSKIGKSMSPEMQEAVELVRTSKDPAGAMQWAMKRLPKQSATFRAGQPLSATEINQLLANDAISKPLSNYVVKKAAYDMSQLMPSDLGSYGGAAAAWGLLSYPGAAAVALARSPKLMALTTGTAAKVAQTEVGKAAISGASEVVGDMAREKLKE